MKSNSATRVSSAVKLDRMNDESRLNLECVVRETGSAPAHAVIWLHGLGADGHDFVPIVPHLKSAALRPVRFIFPHAPVRPVTINGGMQMRAWYDIRGMQIDRDQDQQGIQDSLAAVHRLIDQQIESGIAPERLVLAGFSQGGAMALRAGLERESPLAGIMALSCYLLDAGELSRWARSGNSQVPIFMGHGDHDPIVPVGLGQASVRALESAGFAVQWQTWPMPHSVSPEEIVAIDEWLERVWSKARN